MKIVFTISQDFLLNLTPGGMLNNNAHVSPDVPEDVSMHEPLTMEQFNSPLVDSQYKSTYAVVANSGTYIVTTSKEFNQQENRNSLSWSMMSKKKSLKSVL